MHGGSLEKWSVDSTQCLFVYLACFLTSRATVLYAALVAPYDNVHIRHTIPLLEDGLKYGHSSGDRYAMMLLIAIAVLSCSCFQWVYGLHSYPHGGFPVIYLRTPCVTTVWYMQNQN